MKKEKRTTAKLYIGSVLLGILLFISVIRLEKLVSTSKMESRLPEKYINAAQFVSAHIPMESPKVAITFDDGPNPNYTPLLLEGLKKRGVKATFFLIGMNAEKHKDLVLQIHKEGHLIGNHTYHHVEITKLSNEEAYKELETTSMLIETIIGHGTEFMRPPFGLWQKGLEMNLSMFPVMWTIDPLDWTTENTDEIVHKVVTEVKEGDIILMHDCYHSSVDAALRIIDILQKEGYEFVTVDELVLQ